MIETLLWAVGAVAAIAAYLLIGGFFSARMTRRPEVVRASFCHSCASEQVVDDGDNVSLVLVAAWPLLVPIRLGIDLGATNRVQRRSDRDAVRIDADRRAELAKARHDADLAEQAAREDKAITKRLKATKATVSTTEGHTP